MVVVGGVVATGFGAFGDGAGAATCVAAGTVEVVVRVGRTVVRAAGCVAAERTGDAVARCVAPAVGAALRTRVWWRVATALAVVIGRVAAWAVVLATPEKNPTTPATLRPMAPTE